MPRLRERSRPASRRPGLDHRRALVEVGMHEDRLDHGPDRVAVHVRCRSSAFGVVRRAAVGMKSLHSLGRRRRRAAGSRRRGEQDVLPSPSCRCVPKIVLLPVSWRVGSKRKLCLPSRRPSRAPAGQRPRRLADVGLGVGAAVGAEREQLHHLARVVLVRVRLRVVDPVRGTAASPGRWSPPSAGRGTSRPCARKGWTGRSSAAAWRRPRPRSRTSRGRPAPSARRGAGRSAPCGRATRGGRGPRRRRARSECRRRRRAPVRSAPPCPRAGSASRPRRVSPSCASVGLARGGAEAGAVEQPVRLAGGRSGRRRRRRAAGPGGS